MTIEQRPASVRGAGARPGVAVTVAALGVVFGDIGTSPLYTLRACTSGEHGFAPTPDNVLGLLSLIFWALTMVVTVKYVAVIMRADNRGEGGIFALLALILEPQRSGRSGRIGWAAFLVIVGASLLYGDGMITPAISVLSAIEGLEVAAPGLRPLVLPITCGVLAGLFAIQQRGTGKVGIVFGPVMLVWFAVLGALGGWHIWRHPSVLVALSPRYAVAFFAIHRVHGLLALGGVVLAVTGGEALYADMGHFGRGPIRLAWFALAMPALLAAYFGQGALMLADPSATRSPFFAMVPPGVWTYGLVALATAATVIASQAMITGAFSLTHQAVQLGFFPRVTIHHTSTMTEGQVYVPSINRALAVACLALVVGFRHSTGLGAAYGIAVTGTMLITSIIFFQVTRTIWKWPLWRAVGLLLLFLSFDIPLFGANLLKFADGGFVPVLAAAAISIIMLTWKRGRRIYREHVMAISPPLAKFIAGCGNGAMVRAPGAGVFVTGQSEGVPPVLLNLADRLRVLPETVVLLTVHVAHVPHVGRDAMHVDRLGEGFFRLVIDRGFMDSASVPRALVPAIARFQLPLDPGQVTYYIGRDTFLATKKGQMGRLSERLFDVLSRNAKSAADHFDLPPDRVVEIGTQIDL
jgi:KUP system potassium uptake protein